jgi:hypothetical protein
MMMILLIKTGIIKIQIVMSRKMRILNSIAKSKNLKAKISTKENL